MSPLSKFTSKDISLIEAIKAEKELVMKNYDIKYWNDKIVKKFHRVYHLCKYLGFDPLFFTGLDSELKYSRRHHYLGLIFRKMSSFVQDQVLTTVKLHPSYDALFTEMGLRQTEAFLEGLLTVLEELIWLKDENGKRKDLSEKDIPLIKTILKKHLGSLSEKAWRFWTTGTEGNKRTMAQFLKDLEAFNNRRKYIIDQDGKFIIDKVEGKTGYQYFLEEKFEKFYKNDFEDVKNVPLMLFLGSERDFNFLNIVYYKTHRFNIDYLNRRELRYLIMDI